MSAIQSTFHTNCSLPTTSYHIITAPNSRGTIGILWTSLSALFLCTWSIQHLTVPAQRRTLTRREKFGSAIESSSRKAFWMMVTLIAPEMLTGKALVDLLSAIVSKRNMEKWAHQDGVDWSITHAFFANMGGFVVRFTLDTPVLPKIRPASISINSVGIETIPTAVDSSEPALNGSDVTVDCDIRRDNSTALRDDGCENRASPVGSKPIESREKSPRKSDELQPSLRISGSTGETPPLSYQNLTDDHMGKKVEGRSAQSHIQPYVLTKECEIAFCHRCPCSKRPTEEFAYMSVEDVLAHRCRVFFNGPFRVFPALWKVRRDHLKEEVDSPDVTLNRHIFGLAIHKFGTQKPSLGILELRTLQLSRLQGSAWALDAHQLLLVREMGIIRELPSISSDELNDQSKGDSLAKGLAIVEVLYLIVQLVVRKLEELPSSQLELAVVAFAACSLATYVLVFHKPQDVKTPRYIDAARYPTEDEMITIAKAGCSRIWRLAIEPKSYALPNLALHHCGGRLRPEGMFANGALSASTLFGAIHCLAWNFEFPTPIEQLLWRMASLGIVVLPPLLVVVMNTGLWVHKLVTIIRTGRRPEVPEETGQLAMDSWKQIFFVQFQSFALLLYLFLRLVLLVEIFRTLFYLPPGAFKTSSWFASLPHLG